MAIDVINKKPKAQDSNNQNSLTEILHKDIKLFTGLSDSAKEKFFSALFSTTSAGLDTAGALDVFDEGLKKGTFKDTVALLKTEMMKGALLSEAMIRSKKFNNYEAQSIRLAEETGNLSDILIELRNFYAAKIRLKRQMIGVLSYPIVVVVFAIGVMGFMIQFIVPVFEDMFNQFNAELPALTKWVLNLSNNFWSTLSIAFLLIAGIVTLYYVNRNNVQQRRVLSMVLLKTPVVGRLVKKIQLARFCQMMFLLQAAQMPLIEALRLCKSVIKFYPLEQALSDAETSIEKGASLSAALAKHHIFDKQIIALIRVGENVNQMAEMFEKLSREYSESVEHESLIVGKILEPLIIVMVSMIVGTILLAMYLPIFNMSNIL